MSTELDTVPESPPGARGYALRADRVFDGERLHGPATVVVEGGRIAGVHPGESPLRPDLATVDCGPDTTLLPGLIDTHVHLVFDATPDAAANVQRVGDEELIEQMRVRAQAMLAAGITTARDLGDRRYLTLALRGELASAPAAGPQLLCAGPPITTVRGHCWFLGGEVPAGADLRAVVAERAARGVDAVKVMVTGGQLTPGSHGGLVQFHSQALDALVTEAHRHGLPVAAHAHARAGIADALAARVDSIEHCSFMTEDDVVPDDDLIRAIAAAGIVVSLTLGFAPTDQPMPPDFAARVPKLMDLVRRIVVSGATVTIGSDAGIAPVKPHDVLPLAVVQLAGICGDAAAALAAVTSVAARSCGVPDCKGRLAPGYDADFVVVRGDPVADIATVRDPVAVYRAGELVAGGHPAQGELR
ncbi:MAG: amidohydrolase family protein [Streptosporangiales bacterium]|nr:amidohydrolase family protein [Streptosporangiales bacterium]